MKDLTAVAVPRKKLELTLDQKREICNYYNENSNQFVKIQQTKLILKFNKEFNVNISKSTMSDIIRDREKYTATENLRPLGTIRLREPHHPMLEEALYLWCLNIVSQGVSVSDDMMIEQAKKFGETLAIGQFSYSHGWVAKYKKRHNLSSFKKQGESGSIDKGSLDSLRKNLYEITKNFDLNDIFNLDETALFYQLQPSQTISNRSVYGHKTSKKRLSVALCANYTGKEKLKPIVISTAEKHHCFGKLFEPNNYVSYYHNPKAWMTSVVFTNWTKKLNDNMKKQNRKILLLVDNASSHVQIDLSHVKISFLPPNMTSVLQPMDAGIIRSFKSHYKKLVVKHYLSTLESHNKLIPPSVKEAIYMVKLAWSNVSVDTITNCFKHVDIVSSEKNDKNFSDLISSEETEVRISIEGLYKKIDLSIFAYKPREAESEYISFDQFMDFENGVQSGEVLTDDDIVKLVRNQIDSTDELCQEENEIIEEENIVSYKNLIDSLRSVTNYVEQNKNCLSEKDLNSFIHLSNKLRFSKLEDKQLTLDNFFNI